MESLLVCTDFSPASENAVEYAKKLSSDFSAKLNVFHAYELPLIDPYAPLHKYQEVCKEEEAQVMAKLQKICNTDNCKVSAKQAEAGGGIVDEVKIIDPDLLVLGTSGHSILKKIFGSTTMEVVNNIELPVMVIPDPVRFASFKRVLVATDLSEINDQCLQFLKVIGKQYKTEFVFQHIVKDEEVDAEKESFYQLQDDLNIRFGYDKVRYDLMQYEDVYKGMDLLVSAFEPDLLVIFKHERPFLENIFHKSFTENMILKAKVPLLIFH